MRPSIRPVILLSASVLMIAALFIRAFQPPIPLSKLASLSPGMTQSGVRNVLGDPTQIRAGGHEYEVRGKRYVTEDEWTYQRPLTFGFVNIHFDANQLFKDYSYEKF